MSQKVNYEKQSLLGLLLIVVMIAGVLAVYMKFGMKSLAAEGTFHYAYNERTDMQYPILGITNATCQGDVWTVPKETVAVIQTEVPEDAAYYISMTITSDHKRGFNWQTREGGALLNIQSTGCYVAGITEWYSNSAVFSKLSEGLHITIYSSVDRMQVWVEGLEVIDTPVEDFGSAKPSLSWTYGTVTVQDLQVWVKDVIVPQYDADNQVLYDLVSVDGGNYDKATKTVTVSSQESCTLQTTMPVSAGYYFTMTLQNEGNMEIQFRANGTYIQLTPFFYRIFSGDDAPKTKQMQSSILSSLSGKYSEGETGLKLTAYSDTDTLKIWLGTTKIWEEEVIDSGAAKPNLLWNYEKTIISDIRIWTDEIAISDEPLYCETTDILQYEKDSLSVVNGETINMHQNTLPEGQTFYASYQIVSPDGACWLYNRGQHGKMLLQKNFWGVYSASNKLLIGKSESTGLQQGIKLTFCVEARKVSIWLNGKKIVDRLDTENTSDIMGAPYVYGNSGTTTISDIKVWTKKASLSGSSVSLEGKIKFNFFMEFDKGISEQEKEKSKICFVLPSGEVQEFTFAQAEENTEHGYRFSCMLPAKEMADQVKAVVYYDGVKSQEIYCSIKEYAEKLLAQTTDTDTTTLVKTMLNYGAYAQKYFNYNVNNLANSNLDMTDQGLLGTVAKEDFDIFKFQPLSSKESIEIQEISLQLKSETALRLYFVCAKGIAAEDLEVTSSSCTPVIKETADGENYIAIENILAGTLDGYHTITIRNKVTGQTDTCKVSPFTYGYLVLNSSNKEPLHQLVKALYLYNQAAKVYAAK